jgi:hypothetical protein
MVQSAGSGARPYYRRSIPAPLDEAKMMANDTDPLTSDTFALESQELDQWSRPMNASSSTAASVPKSHQEMMRGLGVVLCNDVFVDLR